MDPFEYMRSLADLWGKGGQAFVTAQQGMFKNMAGLAQVPAADGASGSTPDAMAFTEAGQDFASAWASATELSRAVTARLQGGSSSPVVTETLAKIFDPRNWFTSADDLDRGLQRLAEGPRLADLWDVERKMLNVFNAWVAVRRRSVEHNTVMLQAWTQAAGEFSKKLNEKAEKGETFESARDVLTLWVETANEVLLEAQRSEGFLGTQRELLKASTDLRLAQQEIADYYSEVFGYPTRAEIDDINKVVTELRRELRAMRRAARRRSKDGETSIP